MKNCAFNNRKSFPSASRLEAAKATIEKLSPSGCHNALDFSEPDQCYEFFQLPFSISELKAIIDLTKVNSSRGPNVLNNYILKLLPEVAVKALVDSFNVMLSDGTFPEDWKYYCTLPL